MKHYQQIKILNVIKLTEIMLFYILDIIVAAKDDKYEYYKMTYKVLINNTLPKFLTFAFTKYCFGNQWSLT